MTTMHCPKCGTYTAAERFCQYCGEPFNRGDAQLERASVCICGANARLGAIYCHMCGGRTEEGVIDWKSISGKGKLAVVPDEAGGWNWGAFLLTWIWGLGNRTYISFLVFVPLLNLIWPFVLGVRGSEWAWRNKTWESIEQYRKTQRTWAMWGIGLVGGSVLLTIILVSITAILEGQY